MSERGIAKRWRHVAQIVAAQLRMSVLAALQYRVGFWTEGVLSVIWSFVGIVPLLVAVDHQGVVSGWGPWHLMVLSGWFMICSGIFGFFLEPSLIASMNHIRRGTLDYVLLRPADALVLCLVTEFSPWRFTEILAGAGLVVVSLWNLGLVPSLGDVGLAVFVGATGIVALYALGILMLCLNFRAIRLQNLAFLLESMLDFGRWPVHVFQGVLKAIFMYVVPLAIMTTYPTQALLGELAPKTLGVAVITACTLMLLARLAWSASLRSYVSASS
ncbi:MAG: ABC transporter permease [Nannocystaceae bacterium]